MTVGLLTLNRELSRSSHLAIVPSSLEWGDLRLRRLDWSNGMRTACAGAVSKWSFNGAQVGVVSVC